MKKILPKALLLTGLAFGMSSVAVAGSHGGDKPKVMSGAKAEMLANTCAGCHGSNGVSQGPAAPSIAGMSKDYLTEILVQYKSGDAASTVMGRLMKGYTEEELGQIAEVYAGKTAVAAKQDFDADAAKKGAKLHDKYCEKCHAEGGSSAEDDSGILAGQWTPYLHATLADFTSGNRAMSKKMKKKVESLVEKEGDAGLNALVNYYASQQ